jgi:hypothetical protein
MQEMSAWKFHDVPLNEFADGVSRISSQNYTDFRCSRKRAGDGLWPKAEMKATGRGGGFLGSTRRRGGRGRRSMAATPRSRQLSEQVPPPRLQELGALDDPLGRSGRLLLDHLVGVRLTAQEGIVLSI